VWTPVSFFHDFLILVLRFQHRILITSTEYYGVCVDDEISNDLNRVMIDRFQFATIDDHPGAWLMFIPDSGLIEKRHVPREKALFFLRRPLYAVALFLE
jgi:hypothetical protein